MSFFVHWVVGTHLGVGFVLYTILWLLRLSFPPPLLFGGADYFTAYSAFASAHTPFWCDITLFRLLSLFPFAHSFLVRREVVVACRLA